MLKIQKMEDGEGGRDEDDPPSRYALWRDK